VEDVVSEWEEFYNRARNIRNKVDFSKDSHATAEDTMETVESYGFPKGGDPTLDAACEALSKARAGVRVAVASVEDVCSSSVFVASIAWISMVVSFVFRRDRSVIEDSASSRLLSSPAFIIQLNSAINRLRQSSCYFLNSCPLPPITGSLERHYSHYEEQPRSATFIAKSSVAAAWSSLRNQSNLLLFMRDL